MFGYSLADESFYSLFLDSQGFVVGLVIALFVIGSHLFSLDISFNIFPFEFVDYFLFLEAFLMFGDLFRFYDMIYELNVIFFTFKMI